MSVTDREARMRCLEVAHKGAEPREDVLSRAKEYHEWVMEGVDAPPPAPKPVAGESRKRSGTTAGKTAGKAPRS